MSKQAERPPISRPNVFEYTNAAALVVDMILYLKTQSSQKYSERFLAQKLGIGKSSVHRMMTDRQKTIRVEHVSIFSKLFKFDVRETQYFLNLTLFDLAKTSEDKDRFYQQMLKYIRPFDDALIRQQQYSMLKEWYIPALRELITMYPFDGDYETLGKALIPPIPGKKAKEGIELLEKFHQIKLNADGWYEQCNMHITAKSETIHTALLQHYFQVLDLNKKALNRVERKPSFKMSTATFGIDEQGRQEILEAFEDFRQQVISIAGRRDATMDRVFQLNIGLFPMSKMMPERKNKNQNSTEKDL